MKKLKFVLTCIGELLALPFFCIAVYFFLCIIAR